MSIFWNIFSQSERTVIFEAFLVRASGGGGGGGGGGVGGGGGGGLRMSLAWIAKPFILHIEEEAMPLLVCYCICTFICRSCILNTPLCHLSPFLLSLITV